MLRLQICQFVCTGDASAGPSRLSPEPAMSQVAAGISSQGQLASASGSTMQPTEPQHFEASSNGALPQGFFEVPAASCWLQLCMFMMT